MIQKNSYLLAGAALLIGALPTEASAQNQPLREILKDAVIGFEADRCPRGMSEYKRADGRFLRGIDTSKPMPERRRAGSFQDEAIKSHSHLVTMPNNRSGNPDGATDTTSSAQRAHNRRNYWRGDRTLSNNASTTTIGGEETRPKNVALLFCKFDR